MIQLIIHCHCKNKTDDLHVHVIPQVINGSEFGLMHLEHNGNCGTWSY